MHTQALDLGQSLVQPVLVFVLSYNRKISAIGWRCARLMAPPGLRRNRTPWRDTVHRLAGHQPQQGRVLRETYDLWDYLDESETHCRDCSGTSEIERAHWEELKNAGATWPA